MKPGFRTALNDLLPWLLMAAMTIGWMLDRRAGPSSPVAAPGAEATAEAVPADSAATFALTDLRVRHAAAGRPYLPFLERPSLRAGLYVLDAGAEDRQQPHDQDELYYVVAGRGVMTLGAAEFTVAAGDVLYVPAHAAHRFHHITEALELLVFFSGAAPAASSE